MRRVHFVTSYEYYFKKNSIVKFLIFESGEDINNEQE